MFEPWMQLEYEDSPGAVDYEPREMIGCINDRLYKSLGAGLYEYPGLY